MDEPMVGVKELAARYGPPPSWWYVKAERGEIPSYRLGKYRRFKLSEIAAWVDSQRQGQPAPSNNR
jgi:excisionase family DNA binding protein